MNDIMLMLLIAVMAVIGGGATLYILIYMPVYIVMKTVKHFSAKAEHKNAYVGHDQEN